MVDSAAFWMPLPLSPHSLGWNRLSDVSVQPLAQALANHPTLEWLSYDLHIRSLSPLTLSSTISLWGNNGITDASCPALAELLRTVPTLERLK